MVGPVVQFPVALCLVKIPCLALPLPPVPCLALPRFPVPCLALPLPPQRLRALPVNLQLVCSEMLQRVLTQPSRALLIPLAVVCSEPHRLRQSKMGSLLRQRAINLPEVRLGACLALRRGLLQQEWLVCLIVLQLLNHFSLLGCLAHQQGHLPRPQRIVVRPAWWTARLLLQAKQHPSLQPRFLQLLYLQL